MPISAAVTMLEVARNAAAYHLRERNKGVKMSELPIQFL